MDKNIAYIDINEKLRLPIVFNLNVMEEIQEKYGTLQNWLDLLRPTGENSEVQVKDIKNGLLIMINEAIDIQNEESVDEQREFITYKKLGRLLSNENVVKSMLQMEKVINNSTEVKEEQPKNV